MTKKESLVKIVSIVQNLCHNEQEKIYTESNNIEWPPRDAIVCGLYVTCPSWTFISLNVSGKIHVHLFVGT